ILLDTDHVSVLKYHASERAQRLGQRLNALPADETVATTVVTLEEQMRGWLAAIAKGRTSRRQGGPYRGVADLFDFFAAFTLTALDDRGADHFDSLRAAKLRLGTMDLKIAAVTLVNQALLLSANRRDFEQVSGLRVENWLD